MQSSQPSKGNSLHKNMSYDRDQWDQYTRFLPRRSYASAVLGVVILSVRPSVCHTRALWLIQST